ncbi:hypothetical protein ['Paenibacillus yunnanensis' Narsing Rao et al. 2020]|nr:hypothetical protein [Paenibacillus tengchongensis]
MAFNTGYVLDLTDGRSVIVKVVLFPETEALAYGRDNMCYSFAGLQGSA